MRRVLVAPDSFKGSLSADRVAAAIGRGVQQVHPTAEIDNCPLTDGGEGTAAIMTEAMGGRLMAARVCGPLGEPVDAVWGLVDDGRTAVIEMAQAGGLAQVPLDRRDPTKTTTFGVGELIIEALDHGVEKIVVGIGGSATCDGGAGMAQALGVRFDGVDPGKPMTGGDLVAITAVDVATRDARLGDVLIEVACDVNNPLIGPNGAAVRYAPQKGATPDQVVMLDQGLTRLAQLCGVDPDQEGYGSTGGLGFGLVTFCGARLLRGIDWVLGVMDFDTRARQADLIITGEGCIDAQSLAGKATMGVVDRAKALGKPIVAIAGSRGAGADACLERGLDSIDVLMDVAGDEAEAMREPERLLTELTAGVMLRRQSGHR